MFAPNLKDVNVRPCPAHDLLALDGKLFVESCEVNVLEGKDAQQAVTECLAKSLSIPADWALVPTEEELLAADRARNAFKADHRWFDQTVYFAHCDEVQRDRSRL